MRLLVKMKNFQLETQRDFESVLCRVVSSHDGGFVHVAHATPHRDVASLPPAQIDTDDMSIGSQSVDVSLPDLLPPDDSSVDSLDEYGRQTNTATVPLAATGNYIPQAISDDEVSLPSVDGISGQPGNLLDHSYAAPAQASTGLPINLAELDPDFACLSFYKIFGEPTGLGCLFVRRAQQQQQRATSTIHEILNDAWMELMLSMEEDIITRPLAVHVANLALSSGRSCCRSAARWT